MTSRAGLVTALVLSATAARVVSAGDWPQILGPDRCGVAAADERLADSWPEAGPPRSWERGIGSGHAGVAVVDDTVVLFHRVGDREVVEALDVATGTPRWSAAHSTTFRPQVGGGDGPLCVPSVHDGRVIVCGAQGVLACLDLETGRRIWERRTHREFAAQEGYFGAGSTPLVVGGRVIVNVGGRTGETGIVAFDLATGETVWTATREAASYSAPVRVRVGGGDRVLMVTRLSCLLVDPADGSVRWSFPFGQRGPTVNAASPVLLADGRFLVTAAYGIGSVCATFDDTSARPTAWEATGQLGSQYTTPVLVGDQLMAIDGRDDVPPADLVCIDPATGAVRWRERGFGYGTLVAADGKVVVVKTDGEVLLVQPDPRAIRILARTRPFADRSGGPLRALPALAGGRLYIRDDRDLVSLSVAP